MSNFQFSIFPPEADPPVRRAGNFRKGFTLIEILMAVAIIGLAVTIVTLSFGGLNASQALDKSVLNVISVLDEARAKTLSAVDDSQYGVRIEESQVILFRGASYSASDPGNEVTELHALVAIRNISLSGGGASVVFQRLTGATAQPGTFEVYLRQAADTFKTVTVNSTGVAEAN